LKFGIVVFPGSNCEADCAWVVENLPGGKWEYVWHRDRDLQGADALILPGGFAYGDYLRAGALARFSPVMESVAEFAQGGGPVLGICNGFQVLLEARLLPGAVRVNRGLRYLCRDVHLRVESNRTAFTRLYEPGEVVRMPIGHMEGNYVASPETLAELNDEERVVFRYADETGRLSDAANPNGAMEAIAGIANREGNVVGLMPHPDRCAEGVLGNAAGRAMFESAVTALSASPRSHDRGEDLRGTVWSPVPPGAER
jgi:phosphoribosylformylglycinamidine synthase subunit PurQ / glutaminase